MVSPGEAGEILRHPLGALLRDGEERDLRIHAERRGSDASVDHEQAQDVELSPDWCYIPGVSSRLSRTHSGGNR